MSGNSDRAMPNFGPKPTLEWVPCARMIVDPAYQRDTNSKRSQKLIDTIAKEFRWSRMQPLVLTPRPNGDYAVIDGQHRRAGAIKAGIGALPCMIVPAGDIAAEADAFVRLNAARVSVTPYHMHWSKAAAGEGGALLINSVCARADVEICRYPIDNQKIAPKQTLALEAIRRAIRDYEPPAVILALKSMRQAWSGRRGQLRASVVLGVSRFVFFAETAVIQDRLASALAGHDAYDIEEAARAERRNTGQPGDVIVARMVGEMYAQACRPAAGSTRPQADSPMSKTAA